MSSSMRFMHIRKLDVQMMHKWCILCVLRVSQKEGMDVNYDIQLLYSFERLVRYQSYSKASESLGIDQSTLTRRINKLEKEVEASLFIRNSRCIQLSEFGESFKIYAGQILAMHETFVNDHQGKKLDQILILYRLDWQLQALNRLIKNHQLNQFYDIRLKRAHRKEEIVDNYDFIAEICYKDEIKKEDIVISNVGISAFVNKKHPLAAYRYIKLNELENQDLLLPYRFSTSANHMSQFIHGKKLLYSKNRDDMRSMLFNQPELVAILYSLATIKNDDYIIELPIENMKNMFTLVLRKQKSTLLNKTFINQVKQSLEKGESK